MERSAERGNEERQKEAWTRGSEQKDRGMSERQMVRRKRRRVTRSSCRGDCADVRGKVLRRAIPDLTTSSLSARRDSARLSSVSPRKLTGQPFPRHSLKYKKILAPTTLICIWTMLFSFIAS